MLPLFAALAMLMAGVAASAATAETPAILLLSGKVSELKTELKGGTWKIETVGLKSIAGSGATATITECEELDGKALDTNLCADLLTLTGAKKEKVACRSETLAGVKDPIETILVKVDLHLDSEKSTTGVLQPLLVFKFHGVDGDEEVIVNCGGIKYKIKGKVGCLLLPGLTQIASGGKIEVVCIQEKGKQITGTCVETKLLCEELANDPFLADLGAGFETAGLDLRVEGSFNKDVFIDD
jgi:hypothetical protein